MSFLYTILTFFILACSFSFGQRTTVSGIISGEDSRGIFGVYLYPGNCKAQLFKKEGLMHKFTPNRCLTQLMDSIVIGKLKAYVLPEDVVCLAILETNDFYKKIKQAA
ncbi:hypothetical protein [Flexithrix dorotheae]|uniref:hypothetical protein n=1 Tax=Flexithrix dorotheae TaxID=70993 RepID=UPI0003755F7D|nr:hypothetical protein [Flexithrix dorotheae]